MYEVQLKVSNRATFCLFHADLLHVLLFHTKHGGDMFLLSVNWLSLDYGV
jgi:hypothetical protein